MERTGKSGKASQEVVHPRTTFKVVHTSLRVKVHDPMGESL